MFNTIILKKGYGEFTNNEFKKFSKGDTIFEDPTEELQRWSIEDKEEAYKALAKYKNEYLLDSQVKYVTEYALEFSEYDEDGDFVSGSDYDYAKDNPEHPFKDIFYTIRGEKC